VPNSRSGAPRPRPGTEGVAPTAEGPRPPHLRFRDLDEYRARRELRRFEGTPQRDLFREIRERFLERHRVDARWCLDVGSGPGRFTHRIGSPSSRRVALDLSRSMLALAGAAASGLPPGTLPEVDRVRGDALRPPLAPRAWGEVVVSGNTLGFAAASSPALLERAEELVAPGGTLLVEIAPGPGERSRYLGRLPPRAVGRLLEAPARAIVPRIVREGYAREPRRRSASDFYRWKVSELTRRWSGGGWQLLETLAIAPALGADPERVAAVAASRKAWERLLEVEELAGRDEARWPHAAAVLLAVRREPGDRSGASG
jgi:SAM-dependent methyltransferase